MPPKKRPAKAEIIGDFDTSNIITGKRRSKPVARFDNVIVNPKVVIKTKTSRSSNASSARTTKTSRSKKLIIKKTTSVAKRSKTVNVSSSKKKEPDNDDDQRSDSGLEFQNMEEDSESEGTPGESSSSSSEEEDEVYDDVEEKPRSKYLASVKKRPTKRPLLSTPKAKPITKSNRIVHRVNQVLPVMPLRHVNTRDESTMTPYALARERLHVSAVPESLPCREDEFLNILGYVESAIQEATGTCVYISGVPGTGKTATVLEVIRHLQQQAEEQTIPDFDFVEINGMKLTDPNQAYSILWECMEHGNQDAKKKRYTATHALQMLESKFSKQSVDERTTVVLMDELDLLVTKKQTVMYNFFDWPSRPLSKLIVIAVANTMDLPERIMSNKIASRMGLTRINFQPYKYDQLYQIVQSRLQGIDTFDDNAVQYAARKVSAVSGDARRALDICRRAVEIAELRSSDQEDGKTTPTQVTIRIITEAIDEMYSSPSIAFISSCSLHQKIFLVACMQRSRAIGLAEIEFGDVAHYHIQTCKWHNIEPPNTSDLMRVCESLGQTRALVMEGGRMDICMRLSLNLVEEDIVMACKADKLISRLLQSLPTTNA